MKKESRHISDLSAEELATYFPTTPPKPTYPDWQVCKEHKTSFIFNCHQCMILANQVVETLEECNLGCQLLKSDNPKPERKIKKVYTPHLKYQYHNFLGENQK